jgi:hypothetical protein
VDFQKYKSLARKVFKDLLPGEFEATPDSLEAYQMVKHAAWRDKRAHDSLSDGERMDMFSVTNMTANQIRHLNMMGKTYWK